MSICLIDTSIFTNLLNVPNRNQERETVSESFQDYAGSDCTFLLPMATIIETGNHIAQNGDGRVRRETALRFVETLKKSYKGEEPWTPTPLPSMEDIIGWLDQFPSEAGKNKAPEKREGTSFGDMTIIEEFNRQCRLFPQREVFIWTLDSDLKNYHRSGT